MCFGSIIQEVIGKNLQSANKVVRDLEDTTVKRKMGELSLSNPKKGIQRGI